jgi:hypothetical protein
MSVWVHRIYLATFVVIVLFTTFYLSIEGWAYYNTQLTERFYHNDHATLKPSGAWGHGLGIIGTLLILIGVFSYIARKRYRVFHRWGRLKYWLEFHIFLCSLGPIMVLFHTAFKFGGLVSISFWSMVAVVASGVIGRFIYIQIPRTIEGRELNLSEIQQMKVDLEELLRNRYQVPDEIYANIEAALEAPRHTKEGNLIGNIISKHRNDWAAVGQVRKILRAQNFERKDIKNIIGVLKNEIALDNKISRLQTMQELFRYWHVAHLPFALIMLVIMVIHVGVTLAFGYRWIF